jgi:hypothetical protein
MFSWTGASQASYYYLTVSQYPSGSVAYSTALTGTSFQIPANNLQSGTAYSWLMSSVNSLGNQSANSSPLYFQTASLPTVQTLTATNSATVNGTVMLNGSVNPNGSSTTVYFEYGLTTSYGAITTQTGIGTAAEVFSATVTGLETDHTYHYRVDAVNGIGSSYGSDVVFVTR